jgi:hypothetical protein
MILAILGMMIIVTFINSFTSNLREKAAPDYESQRNAGIAEDMILFRNLSITVVILIVIGLCMIMYE